VKSTPPRIVVGIDGSATARAALRWAICEAALDDAELEVVHAWHTPRLIVPEAYSVELVEEGDIEQAARVLIAEELAKVGAGAGLVPVVRTPRHGTAARSLVDRSAGALLVVVGRSGVGGHSLLGTVADQVAHHAACPVVVVPGREAVPTGEIVVGVDGSEHAADAARWAFDEARRRDLNLVALLAWSLLDQVPLPGGRDFDPNYRADEAHRALDAALADALPEGSRGVTRRVVNDLAADALVAASETADLLVVGARGLGGFRSLLLGSVSRKVLDRALCPTVVIRHTEP